MVRPLVRSLADTGPMLHTLVDGLTERAGWAFEPKWDGWRCLAIVDEAAVDLRIRRGVDLAPWFPELTRPPAALDVGRAVLDGEIVVLRDGRSDFDAISGRPTRLLGRVGGPSATASVGAVPLMVGDTSPPRFVATRDFQRPPMTRPPRAADADALNVVVTP